MNVDDSMMINIWSYNMSSPTLQRTESVTVSKSLGIIKPRPAW